ncbi:MAG TPA: sigma-70 family RNA polymerase sigma factor [Dictyoglomaceae bacterium]|nr:sigma-70 family RNA polymerase sigma factor [Dictyoglomaceae bacterium]HOL39606.1 sigma-70 family RNA polymerase sigma factor [Dictyoglomaceae bacterium]HPP16552.1 sigma-70 family RNA polymerase sigma factor [Dictyoglomaceae bacterium]
MEDDLFEEELFRDIDEIIEKYKNKEEDNTEVKKSPPKDDKPHYKVKTIKIQSKDLENEYPQEDNFVWNIHEEEISKYRVLTPQEERILAQKAKTDKEAKEKFILSNLRLVHSIAKRYQRLGLDYSDLVQEGYIGLITAVEHYNPNLGYKFSTYATWWIRQTMTRAIADCSSLIRVPVHFQEEMRHMRRAEREFKEKFKREPKLEELAEYSGISMEKLLQMKNSLFKICPFDVPINELSTEELDGNSDLLNDSDDEDLCIQDLLCDEENIEEEVEKEYIANKIREMLDTLSEREREILILRFGLEDGIPKTLEEIGKIFGLTRERIRQIEAKAIRHLKHPSRSKELRDFFK